MFTCVCVQCADVETPSPKATGLSAITLPLHDPHEIEICLPTHLRTIEPLLFCMCAHCHHCLVTQLHLAFMSLPGSEPMSFLESLPLLVVYRGPYAKTVKEVGVMNIFLTLPVPKAWYVALNHQPMCHIPHQ